MNLTDRITLLNVRLLQVEKSINSAVQRRLNRLSTVFDTAVRDIALNDSSVLPVEVSGLLVSEIDLLIKSILDAITSVYERFADGINRVVIGGPDAEQLSFSLTTFVDLQDEPRIDDTFFQMVGDVVGLTSDEARELMSTLMLWGLRQDELWHNWRERLLIDIRSSVASRLNELRTIGLDGNPVDGTPTRRVKSTVRAGIDVASGRAIKPAIGLVSNGLFAGAGQLLVKAFALNPAVNGRVIWNANFETACNRCRRKHGTEIRFANGKLMDEIPPLHPFCRCFPTVVLNDGTVISFSEWLDRLSPRLRKSVTRNESVSGIVMDTGDWFSE